MNELSDAELVKRYHIDSKNILFVTDLVREALMSDTKRRQPLTPEMKVSIFLFTSHMSMCSSI